MHWCVLCARPQVDPSLSRTVVVSTKLDTRIPQVGGHSTGLAACCMGLEGGSARCTADLQRLLHTYAAPVSVPSLPACARSRP